MMQEVDEMLLDKVDDRLPLVGPSNQMGVQSRPSQVNQGKLAYLNSQSSSDNNMIKSQPSSLMIQTELGGQASSSDSQIGGGQLVKLSHNGNTSKNDNYVQLPSSQP